MSDPTAPAPKAPKKVVDWDAIHPHYRAGVRALKDIGREFEVSDAAIIKHARNNGWTRDLQGKIRAKADAKVSAAMVSAEVSETNKKAAKAREEVVVEVEATVQSRIRLAHRTDIAKSRALVVTLMDELKTETERPEPKKVTKATPARLPLAARTTMAKSLAEALKTTIGLEREAYAIVSDANLENPIAKLISQLGQTTLPVATQDPDFDA